MNRGWGGMLEGIAAHAAVSFECLNPIIEPIVDHESASVDPQGNWRNMEGGK